MIEVRYGWVFAKFKDNLYSVKLSNPLIKLIPWSGMNLLFEFNYSSSILYNCNIIYPNWYKSKNLSKFSSITLDLPKLINLMLLFSSNKIWVFVKLLWKILFYYNSVKIFINY